MTHFVRFTLVGVCVLGVAAMVAAQGQPTPVMRIGQWVEVGGETPVVVVLQAQERLKAAGFNPGPVDGIFALQTQMALRQYQRHYGLPVTGVLDTATRKALGVK